MITVSFQKIALHPGDRVLDIGCGAGRHVCACTRKKDVQVWGVDRCEKDLLKARENLNFERCYGVSHGIWQLLSGDIKHLPFPDEFFDLVICSEVLEHIHDDHIAMKEIIRVLKKNKHLVVSVPRYTPERICWALSEDYRSTPGGHIRIYRHYQIIQRLESLGVKKWGLHYAHALHSMYWWLKCWVGPNQDQNIWVKSYHDFLVWDMIHKSRWVRLFEKLLNPFVGKSLVIYFQKTDQG
ncbi:MAG: methyltransferase domain-containing protein [Candidatus Magnetomorum sp.]|nr:methyltransferase domain-containing protein [Candidatus Magnetomorum sp.]